MNNKVRINGSYILLIVTVLLISLIVNVYQNITYGKYKEEFQQQFYDDLEEIRYRNEAVLSILDSSVKANSISKDELLTLYKNYNAMANIEVDLWEYYFKYKDNSFMKIDNIENQFTSDNKNQTYWKIAELISSYLQEDINSNNDTVNLTAKKATDFIMMKDLSNDLNNFYIDFYNKNCKNLEDEKRANKVIKEGYWVDMLQGIEEVNEKYVEYPFAYE